MKKPLVILGAGGFAREAYCWIDGNVHSVAAFFDEVPKPGLKIFGIPLIQDLRAHAGAEFLVAVGGPAAKAKLARLAKENGLIPCSPIVHPTAVLGLDVELSPGSIICPQAVLTTHIRCGENFMANLGATVGHDCVVGNHVTISPSANVSGFVKLGDLVYVGTNAAIREGVAIGEASTVGMGAVVVKDVPANTVVVGNPARPLQRG